MNEVADQHHFIVLYPQQSLQANPLRCWNWFEPRTREGAGEAAAIVTEIQPGFGGDAVGAAAAVGASGGEVTKQNAIDD